jgi:enoyl-CoA hydratase
VELRRDLEDGILTITMDDGARNALTPDDLDDLTTVLDETAEDGDVDAVVLAGNGTIFTAGLDVKWMQQATSEDVGAMLRTLGRTVMRLWGDARPTVAACTGHTVAAGTMLAMASDHAVAAEGDHSWGLMETRIAFEMPMFGIELARANVAAHRVDDLILPGAVCDPETAVAVGFADELAPIDEVLDRARARAVELATLPPHTYAGTKRRLRAATIVRVLGELDDDIDLVLGTSPYAP